MRGRGGSGDGATTIPTTTAGATTTTTTTTTTWERCCRCCGVRVTRAVIRRWTPTVFGYAMLVSLLASNLLPPVWAATRPPPPPAPRLPLPTPPRDAGGGHRSLDDTGGGHGQGQGQHKGHGNRSWRSSPLHNGDQLRDTTDPAPSRPDSPSLPHRREKDSPPSHPARDRDSSSLSSTFSQPARDRDSPPSSSPRDSVSIPSERETDSPASVFPSSSSSSSSQRDVITGTWLSPRQCHGWGAHLQRLVWKRSAGPHPHRQHASASSHRHYQHHPAPSLTSLPSPSYSFSPPSASSSSSSSSFSAGLSPSSTSSEDGSQRGLPQSGVRVVLHPHLSLPLHPHHRQPQPQHLTFQLGEAETQRREIRVAEGEGEGEGGQDEIVSSESEDPPLCNVTDQKKKVPGLCECSSCSKPFNHSHPESARARRSRLPLTEWLTCQMCNCRSRQQRVNVLVGTRLPFCSQFPLTHLLPCASPSPAPCPCEEGEGGGCSEDVVEGDDGCMCTREDCEGRVHDLLAKDSEAEERYQEFMDILGRYDCSVEYSVKWSCQHCQEAYKQWLCASTLTYYLQGQTLRPCKTFCQQVEAMCPFFRPKVDTHEGDPSFICKDPEIEGGVHPDGSHVTSACFHLCHVISGAEIKQTFCGTNQSRCEDLRGQLEGCPALPAPSSVASRTDNSSGSVNTTSAARASVYSEGRGWVRTLVSWGVTLTVTGASSDLSAVRLTTVWIVVVAGSTMMLSWLWLALTSYPYSCIGLT